MQFCAECGAILNLFEFATRELCTDCFQKQAPAKTETPPPPPAPVIPAGVCNCTKLPENVNLLLSDGKIVIRSEEGWILWSGSIDQPHQLQMALKRAGKIYAIRSRSKKPVTE